MAIAGPSCDPKRDALQRILNSRTLANRARLRQFLSVVGEAALAGNTADLKEQSLAISVFGRQSGQTTSDDNIVRVTARQLRAKIAEYYLTEGKGDRWRVEIPRGTYVPVFLESGDAPFAELAAPRPLPETATRWPLRTDWLLAGAIGALISLTILATWYAHQPARKTTILALMQPQPDRRVLIVCADATMQLYKAVAGSAPMLSEYERHVIPEPLASDLPHNRVLQWIESVQLVGTGNLSSLAKLIPAFSPGTVEVRHPRQVTDRDFVDSNVILLSGPFANPWAQLFESKLSFQVTGDAQGHAYIRNVRPRPGEEAVYRTNEHDGSRRTYCRVAFLPNLSGRGRVLLIGGPSTAIEMVSTWLSDATLYQELRKRLGGAPTAPMPFFEILVEATEVSGTPVSVRLLSVRRADL